jgi:hypothetical protein
MRKIILYWVISLFWGSSAIAQITIPPALLPEAGDTLFTAVDQLPTTMRPLMAGRSQRWDLTTLQSPFTRRVVWRPANQGSYARSFRTAELVAQVDENTEGYFRTTSNELYLVGAYGPDPLGLNRRVLIRYQPALLERRLPLRYGDAFQNDATAIYTLGNDELPSAFRKKLPISPDSIRVRVSYDRQFYVDGWGKLLAPGGFYDVLREKRTEIRDFRIEGKIGNRKWQDLTGIIKERQLLRSTTSISYNYYSNEEKEPIAIVWMDPSEQKPLRAEYKANDPEASIQNMNNLKADVYAFPNPAIINVRFEFYNLPPGTYTLSIYNILGVEQWTRRYIVNGNFTEKADISELKRGAYLYSLKDENGKTITTKRLMVLRP